MCADVLWKLRDEVADAAHGFVPQFVELVGADSGKQLLKTGLAVPDVRAEAAAVEDGLKSGRARFVHYTQVFNDGRPQSARPSCPWSPADPLVASSATYS